jgi:quercetin dioxygenase-like cupin family protein
MGAPDPAVFPFVLAPGAGEALWYVNNRAVVKASADSTGSSFGLVEMAVAPGHDPPLHIHHAEDEALWVLEGQFTIQVGNERIAAGPGSFVFQPRGVAHTFRLESATPGRLLVLLFPGGGEGFFVAGGRPAEHDGMPTPAEPDFARLAAAAERFGIEFVGPPLPPSGPAAPGSDLSRRHLPD